jgi:hypothetical protein
MGYLKIYLLAIFILQLNSKIKIKYVYAIKFIGNKFFCNEVRVLIHINPNSTWGESIIFSKVVKSFLPKLSGVWMVIIGVICFAWPNA